MPRGARRGRSALAASAAASAAAAAFALLSTPEAAAAQDPDLPPCPSIALDDVRVLAAPCADPAMACDLDAGCIGAVVSYVGDRVDLTRFDQAPPPEYVADCVAPFALSEEVTSTIPQETLGAMIACDFELVTARFERDFAPGGATAPAPATAPA